MNQAILHSEYAAAANTRSNRQESLLQKIRDRLTRVLEFHQTGPGNKQMPQTFIEANLLDDVMGPEIKRTLRF